MIEIILFAIGILAFIFAITKREVIGERSQEVSEREYFENLVHRDSLRNGIDL